MGNQHFLLEEGFASMVEAEGKSSSSQAFCKFSDIKGRLM